MIELRTPEEIQQMRPVGRFVAQTLTKLAKAATVGTNLLELEQYARELIEQAGAKSCYVDYHPSFGGSPFGNVLCISVNDAVLHGLPHDYRLADSDVLSLDFAVSLDGWVADSAITVIMGEPKPEDQRLIAVTNEALDSAIAAAVVGNRIGDISAAITAVAHNAGYTVNREFGGHGVGRTMHEDPQVPNSGRAGYGMRLKPGLVIAIEPWFMHTTDEIRVDKDGWTLRSADGSRGAHAEHTIAVTEDGPIILTDRSGLE